MKTAIKMFILIAFIVVGASPAFSQDMPAKAEDPELLPGMESKAFEEELRWLKAETFVITASKTLENIKKTAASITVITDRELRDMGARNLADALRTVPGIGLTQNSIGVWEIESRGVKTYFSEKVLFMLNSRPIDIHLVNGGSTSQPRLDNLPTDNIQRIEIIRGPGSALYGANAFTALINVITMDGADINGIEISARGGSFDTQQYNILLGKKLGEFDVAANLNFYDTHGFDALVEKDLQTKLDQIMGTTASLAPGNPDSWEKKYDAELKVGYKGLKLQGRYIKREAGSFFGITNALTDDSHLEYDFYTLGLEYTRDINDRFDLITRVYHDYMSFDNYWEVFPEKYVKNTAGCTKTGIEIQTNYQFNETNHVVAGIMGELQRQRDVTNFANYHPITGEPVGDPSGLHDWSDSLNWNGDHDRDLWAIYLEDIWDIGDYLRLTIGGRYDHFSDFGGVFNPRAGFAYEFIKNYRLKMMYGQAFRAPTFAEQYNKNGPGWLGNPDVQPEKVKTVEVSLSADITDSISAGLTYFHNDISDLIGFSEPDANGTSTTANLHSVTSQGIELEMKAKFRRGSYLAANYTYQKPEDSDTGRELPDVPTHKGNIMANIRLSKYFIWYTHLFFKGKTPRAEGDSRDEVPGYELVNTTLTVRKFSEKLDGLELKASVYNLFDKDYVDPAPPDTLPGDYPQPGRSFVFEMRYEW